MRRYEGTKMGIHAMCGKFWHTRDNVSIGILLWLLYQFDSNNGKISVRTNIVVTMAKRYICF